MLARPGGSVPEPLLPPDLALQNPDLVGGHALHVFPKLGQVLVMLDRDGDENYQLMLVPMTGGFPVPAFGGQLADFRCHAAKVDIERNLVYLLATALFDDAYGLGYLNLENFPRAPIEPVTITGIRHTGTGELVTLDHLRDQRYRLTYNIDGASWLYEGEFDEEQRAMRLLPVLAGAGAIANGVLESVYYERASDRFVLAYSTATSPTQIYSVGGPDRGDIVQHTSERVLGIAPDLLAPGEDASFTSFDGLRLSARLYLPAAPPRRSASTGRARWCTTFTAGRRARNGRTSPGSPCR